MIEAILPPGVVAAEARDDGAAAELHPEEERLLERAVEKRRREFATGRACAREALERLGVAPGPILRGERGEPLWPVGAIGSITHCHGYRGCAVARAGELLALGIDAEPHEPLPEPLIGDVAGAAEIAQLGALARSDPSVHWDRLLFCAKEAVYKAWFPLAERWLGFEDALLTIDPRAGAFSARLLVPGPLVAGAELRGFEGRWLRGDGLLLAATWLSPGSQESL